MSEFDIEDMLVRYLDGEMEESERMALEERINRDPALQQQLDNLRLAIDAVRYKGLARKVATIHQEMAPQIDRNQDPVRSTVRMFTRRTMGIAAGLTVAIVMLSGWWAYKTRNQQIFADHFVEFTESAVRSEAKLSYISDQYLNKNFKAVVQASGNTGLTGKDSILVAVSCMHEKRFEMAETWFQAIQNSGSAYHDDADYYLAYTYMSEGQFKKAYELLTAIHNDPNHVYHSAVSNLLLNKVKFRTL